MHLPKKTLLILALSSIILFIFSSLYVLFLGKNPINEGPYYKVSNVRSSDFTAITQKESWKRPFPDSHVNLLKRKVIVDSFVAAANNLGTIVLAFDTHNKSIEDKIVFKLKEAKDKSWYYQATYNANQIQNNVPFPFGFPVINNSKGKNYVFEIESSRGSFDNSLAINKNNNYYSKYKYSKKVILGNIKIFSEFMPLKIKSKIVTIAYSEVALIFFSSVMPLFLYLFLLIYKKESKKIEKFYLTKRFLKFINARTFRS